MAHSIRRARLGRLESVISRSPPGPPTEAAEKVAAHTFGINLLCRFEDLLSAGTRLPALQVGGIRVPSVWATCFVPRLAYDRCLDAHGQRRLLGGSKQQTDDP